MRNHAGSDHHDDFNYDVLAEDVVRFADAQGLDKFTVLGHSLGARTAMTLACRFPERVTGVIAVDAAPVNEVGGAFGTFTYKVIEFMFKLKEDGVSSKDAIEKAEEFFRGRPEFVHLIKMNLDRNSEVVKWAANIDSIYSNFNHVRSFNEDLRYPEDTAYHIVGGKSIIYELSQYQKVFPLISEENIDIIEGAGHWVHFDKPMETIESISKFLHKMD